MSVGAILSQLSGWWWLRRHAHQFARADEGLPRLLVDVSVIIRSDAGTGIQRVVRAIWTELLRHQGEHFELVPVFAGATAGYRVASLDFLERPTSMLDDAPPAAARRGDRFLGLDLCAHYLPRYAAQIKAWRNQGASIHMLVYDILPILRPDWFRRPLRVRFSRWFNLVLAEADQAICISPQVARDVRERLRKLPPTRKIDIVTLRMGADIAASRPSAGVSEEIRHLVDGLRFRRSVLMVGTIEPRKGYDVALSAFDYLWQNYGGDAPDLVIVGRPGWKTDLLQDWLHAHPEAGGRLHWLRDASDEELALLYERTDGLLMASYGEGFGLPLIEAAAHGCPTLARDLPVFKEQQVSATMFFSDDHPAALGEDIMRLISHARTGAAPRASVTTWRECVDDLLDHLQIGDLPSTGRTHMPQAC